MAIGDLRSRDVHRFINGNRDEGGLWLFIHVPKTAGSSFRKELAETLRPQRNIHINYDSDEPFAQQMETAIARFLEADKYTYFRFASGHINMDQALLIRRNRPDTALLPFSGTQLTGSFPISGIRELLHIHPTRTSSKDILRLMHTLPIR